MDWIETQAYRGPYNTLLMLRRSLWERAEKAGLTKADFHQAMAQTPQPIVATGGLAEAGLALVETWERRRQEGEQADTNKAA